MKRYAMLLLAVLTIAQTAFAQLKTSYFMEGSVFRTDLNPALTPTRGYINLPGIGGIGVGVSNNFFSADNFLFPKGDDLVLFLNNRVGKDEFLKRLPQNNNLSFNIQTNLLGFGAHTKRLFWAFGMNLRAEADITIPKEFFSTLKTLGNGMHDLSGFNASVNSYVEAYLGFAVPIAKIATVGFRVKGLLGVAQANFESQTLYANVTDETVRAELAGKIRINSPVTRNDYMPGAKVNFQDLVSHTSMTEILGGIKSGGAAIDLGAEVRLLDEHLKVSAAITDLGFIMWNGGTSANTVMSADFYWNGIDFDSGEQDSGSSDFEHVYGAKSKNYARRLTTALNIGVEYAILRNRIGIGLLSHTRFSQYYTSTDLTASLNFRPASWVTLTASHSFLQHNKLGVFGWALNFHPAGINLFLGMDYIGGKWAKTGSSAVGSDIEDETAASPLGNIGAVIPYPVQQKSLNLYFGLSISLGRAKYMSYERRVMTRRGIERYEERQRRAAEKRENKR